MHKSFKKALIIFAKQPIAGRVKTRLIPALTAEGAADFYCCMLKDILSRTAACGLDRFLFYEEEAGAAEYFARITGGMTCLQQKGADLGERMAGAFRYVFDRGYESVAIIGTDSPDLPVRFIVSSYERLQQCGAGVVIGPSEDGGYYLLAMNHPHDGLFRQVAWSTGEVLGKTLENARVEGLRVDLLPQWYDVDEAKDLTRSELLDVNNAAPLTRQFVGEWLKLQAELGPYLRTSTS